MSRGLVCYVCSPQALESVTLFVRIIFGAVAGPRRRDAGIDDFCAARVLLRPVCELAVGGVGFRQRRMRAECRES